MLKKRVPSLKKLAKTNRERRPEDSPPSSEVETGGGRSPTPRGCVALYVGEECRRFVVPTRFLCHPLFKMVLDKTYKEFGFDQKSGLVVPCTVFAFQEILNTIEANHGSFHFGELVHEFL
ncbi:unnamed protein product [Citrullus colocynthis]|uniref:Uncharacterized protein n=1 Tax=Citrullus colocynthis TaxID=252529 RepID=A0ABP0YUQ0_9ROSI